MLYPQAGDHGQRLSQEEATERVPDQPDLISLRRQAPQPGHQPEHDALVSLDQCGVREKLGAVSRPGQPTGQQQQRQATASEAMNQNDSHTRFNGHAGATRAPNGRTQQRWTVAVRIADRNVNPASAASKGSASWPLVSYHFAARVNSQSPSADVILTLHCNSTLPKTSDREPSLGNDPSGDPAMRPSSATTAGRMREGNGCISCQVSSTLYLTGVPLRLAGPMTNSLAQTDCASNKIARIKVRIASSASTTGELGPCRTSMRSLQPFGSEMLRLFGLTKGFMCYATPNAELSRSR